MFRKHQSEELREQCSDPKVELWTNFRIILYFIFQLAYFPVNKIIQGKSQEVKI